MTRYPARYADGRTATTRRVEVVVEAAGLRIHETGDPGTDPDAAPGGAHATLAFWPHEALRPVDPIRPGRAVRLACAGDDEARLVSDDPRFIDALLAAVPGLGHRGRWGRVSWRRTAAWIGGVAVVLWLAFVLANRLTGPLAHVIPTSWKAALGDASVEQLITLLRSEKQGNTGAICRREGGTAALDALVDRLAAAADGKEAFTVRVADLEMINAFAAPGGRIVLLRGLIAAAHTSDEIAGVLAHEMAHALENHPTKAVIRVIGVHALIGAVTGGSRSADIAAGLGEVLIALRYSRANEADADRIAVAMLERAGIRTAGLAAFLERMAERRKDMPKAPSILSTHPATRDRIAALPRRAGGPAMAEKEWLALRAICDR